MKRIKMFGLLALAAMATVALIGATSASAAKFTAGKVGAKAIETTIEKYVGTITGSSSECKSHNVVGVTESLESESIQGTVETSECTLFGFAGTVTNNGCEFVMYASGEGKVIGEGCTVVGAVNNAFAKCKVVVKPQSLSKAASFANGEKDIVVTATHSGVVSEVTESTGFCPLTVGKHTNASFYGKSTVQAEGTTVSWDE